MSQQEVKKSRRAGRPPKYDWEDKREICRRLYVDEQKSANEIIQYFAEHFHADPAELPCRKGFIRQFQLWGFPIQTKSLSPESEAAAAARITELWEQNVNQKDIKAALEDEGWDLKTYEFTKLWRKNGLRLRNEHGYKLPTPEGKKKRRASAANLDQGQDDDAAEQQPAVTAPIVAPMEPEESAARAQRLFEIQMESDQRLNSRKRRRRIRGYGHLPPDAAGTAPRYASETSLDECKAYLHLDNETYIAIRKEYTAICEEMGVIKKGDCAEGMWEESKRRLIRENPHLAAITHPSQPDQDKKNIALECIAADVTKRMRVTTRSITIADANNILDLNPTESKAIRRSFYEILAADKFESRLVSGEEHWGELRRLWFDSYDKLQQIVEANDPEKMRAVDLLGRDAMKRFREDRNNRGERIVVQQNAEYGPGPGPAWAAKAPRTKRTPAKTRKIPENVAPVAVVTAGPDPEIDPNQTAIEDRLANYPQVRAAVAGRGYPPQPNGNLMASLAQATGNIDFDLDPALAGNPGALPFSSLPPEAPMMNYSNPIPAYFRLAPESHVFDHHSPMWLGKLDAPTMEALHAAAVGKSSVSTVNRISGVVRNQDGSEHSWLVENDDELHAYLAEAGDKATFYVVLGDGYAR